MYSTESICTNSIRTLLGRDPRNPSPRTEPRMKLLTENFDLMDKSTLLENSHHVFCRILTAKLLEAKEKRIHG